ncbi:uncharacterized protein [Salminus brasiliensis]|uniref:uncharacterized protein n=1 Tax=Salminus brasiliensis TaxID=930266 RepID=UPI003B82E4D3
MARKPAFLAIAAFLTLATCFPPWPAVSARVSYTLRGTKCVEDCRLYGSEYKCRTLMEDGRTDVQRCSPQKDLDVASKLGHSIDDRDIKYSVHSKKMMREGDKEEECKEVSFVLNPDANIAEGRGFEEEVEEIVNRWNWHLSDKIKSNLVTTDGLRIDLQNLPYVKSMGDRQFYNLQIQVNEKRQNSKKSTTLSQIFLPVDEVVPLKIVREAFLMSFKKKAGVFIKVMKKEEIKACEEAKKKKKPRG